MSKLISNVFVENEWYGPAYGNTDRVPSDIAAKIPNPKAWENGALPDGPIFTDVEPPRAGRKSGEAAWRAYAERLGIELPDDVNRDEIITLVDALKD